MYRAGCPRHRSHHRVSVGSHGYVAQDPAGRTCRHTRRPSWLRKVADAERIAAARSGIEEQQRLHAW